MMDRLDSQQLLDLAFLDAAQGGAVDVGDVVGDVADLLGEDDSHLSFPTLMALLSPPVFEPSSTPETLSPNGTASSFPSSPQTAAQLVGSTPKVSALVSAPEGPQGLKPVAYQDAAVTTGVVPNQSWLQTYWVSGTSFDDSSAPDVLHSALQPGYVHGTGAKGRAPQKSDQFLSNSSGESDHPAAITGKKRRVRNQYQMELNRLAQQKYRERKKQERSELQAAVDQLAAQVAAFKVLEAKTNALEAENARLQSSLAEQDTTIGMLQQQVSSGASQLEATRGDLAKSQDQAQQHKKYIQCHDLRVEQQDQVIACLKDQLRSSRAHSCGDEGGSDSDAQSNAAVHEKIVAAVKATIYGDNPKLQGLRAQLDSLPMAVVSDICTNIFGVVKDTMRETSGANAVQGLAACTALPRGPCAPCCCGVV